MCALQERYNSGITQLYDVWRIYMSWYTVLLSFTVAALVFYKDIAGVGSGATWRRILI